MVAGNYYDKSGTRNPAERLLVEAFQRRLTRLLGCCDLSRVLEIGCADGRNFGTIREIEPEARIVGVDIDDDLLAKASERGAETLRVDPHRPFELPWPDQAFTTVLAIEVLEHAIEPGTMLAEARRLTVGHMVASVPLEPLWRALNVLRLKYLRAFGNTPGHLNHWGPAGFRRLLGRQFAVVDFALQVPWMFALCTPLPGRGVAAG